MQHGHILQSGGLEMGSQSQKLDVAHLLQAMSLLSMPGRNGHIVQQAEPRGVGSPAVVSPEVERVRIRWEPALEGPLTQLLL